MPQRCHSAVLAFAVTALCSLSLSQRCAHRCLTAVGFLLCTRLKQFLSSILAFITSEANQNKQSMSEPGSQLPRIQRITSLCKGSIAFALGMYNSIGTLYDDVTSYNYQLKSSIPEKTVQKRGSPAWACDHTVRDIHLCKQ